MRPPRADSARPLPDPVSTSPVAALRIMPVHVLAPVGAAAPSMQRSLDRVDCDAFVLIAAMNPCPCRYSGGPWRACTCAPGGNRPVPEEVVNWGPSETAKRSSSLALRSSAGTPSLDELCQALLGRQRDIASVDCAPRSSEESRDGTRRAQASAAPPDYSMAGRLGRVGPSHRAALGAMTAGARTIGPVSGRVAGTGGTAQLLAVARAA